MQKRNFKNNNTHTEGGFNLVEIVIASSILMVSLLSVIVIASQSIAISHRSVNTYIATTLLEEGAEAVRIVRDNAWTNISSLTAGTTYYPKFTAPGTWALTTTSADGTVGAFTRTVVFSSVVRDGSSNIASSGSADTGTKLVTVTVSWKDTTGNTVSKTLSFYIANIFS